MTALDAYRPADSTQRAVRDEILEYCRVHPDALWPLARPGHLTASAFVVDATGARTLLTLHRKLGRWLQLGGHCDGEGDLAAVALREATEESGIDGLRCMQGIADLDIQEIPGTGEPSHLHFDVRFLVVAPPGAQARASEESLDLRWFDSDELERLDLDHGLLRLARSCFSRARGRAVQAE